MQQNPKEIIGYIVNGLTIAVYFALLSMLEIPPALQALQVVGWILLAAGIALVILAFAALLGKHTEAVINSGILSVVRNPIYLGAIFIYLAMAFFLPHWIMVILSIVNVMYIYWFMVFEEQKNTEKFGDDYQRYMQSVPRANIFAGFVRLVRRKE